jgi:hypothetical protein
MDFLPCCDHFFAFPGSAIVAKYTNAVVEAHAAGI